MIPINLFVFPIIGGYYVLIKAERFRYRQQRLESQKLIFNSILAGIILMMAALAITKVITYYFPEGVYKAKSYFPVSTPYFGTSLLSFIIAILYTEISNFIYSKDRQVRNAINKIGNEFERLCESCYRNVDLIQVTLKNDKCYVGLIKALPIPTHSSYIRMLPVYSGYRTKDKKELEFTTQYLDVYATYVQEGAVYDIRDLTNLVIKIDEIVSATKFDSEMYDRFLKQQVDFDTSVTEPNH